MANKKSSKKRVNKKIAKTVIKHSPTWLIIALVIIIVLAGVGFFLYKQGVFDNFLKKDNNAGNNLENINTNTDNNSKNTDTNTDNNSKNTDTNSTIVDGELFIEFLELGNQYTGDSIYIKAGNNDILIDAGSRNSSSDAISSEVNKYCKDGKLEYVIATHAHQDHIAGFVGTAKAPGIFDRYECGIIIDFPKTNNTTSSKPTQVYNNYVAKLNAEEEAGAKHYTALQCYNNEDGAQRIYELTDDIKMEVLYNYYYENETSNENNYSVCVMFSHGDRKFLFTGDLEDQGEKKLVENNKLSKVNLYKAGHHGSYTAGSDELLSVIKPDTIVCCCCAGSTEYTSNPDNTFPAQAFINRAFKYTKDVYVTTLSIDEEPKYTSMNGTITVQSNKEGIKYSFSNNDTRLIDTEWFKKNRTWDGE